MRVSGSRRLPVPPARITPFMASFSCSHGGDPERGAELHGAQERYLLAAAGCLPARPPPPWDSALVPRSALVAGRGDQHELVVREELPEHARKRERVLAPYR